MQNDAFRIALGHVYVAAITSGMKPIVGDMRISALPPQDPAQRGAWAETRAAHYLQRRGWRLCARNWIGGGGELDLVCSRWRTLLIVEVRYRSHDQPFVSIDTDKISHLKQASKALIRQHKLQQYVLRFDAIGVMSDGHVEWRKNIC